MRYQAEFMVGFSGEADKLYANANQTASEAFSNIRTVCCVHDPSMPTSHIVPPGLAWHGSKCRHHEAWQRQPPFATFCRAARFTLIKQSALDVFSFVCYWFIAHILFFRVVQVAAFQMENSISVLYNKLLDPPTKASEKRAQVLAFPFVGARSFLKDHCTTANTKTT